MQHNFECTKCKVKFSVEHEANDINIVRRELTIRCPKCDMKWGEVKSQIVHQLNVSVGTENEQKINSLRKENLERSREAISMAGAYQATQPREEMVNIEPKYFSDNKHHSSISVQKKVVSSINEKLNP